METFRIQNLSFAYPGPSGPALEKVSLDVAEGSFLVLCGQSGCGKTTLLRQLKPSMAPHGTREGTRPGAAGGEPGHRLCEPVPGQPAGDG